MNIRFPFFLMVLVLFAWTSCADVTFQEPMPQHRRNLNHFPKLWRGTWSNGDDINIKIEADRFIDLDSEESFPLGEKIILRRFKGYLVLSSFKEDYRTWEVTLGKRKSNQIELLSFDSEHMDDWRWISGLKVGSFPVLPDDPVKSYVIEANNVAFLDLIENGGVKTIGVLERVQ